MMFEPIVIFCYAMMLSACSFVLGCLHGSRHATGDEPEDGDGERMPVPFENSHVMIDDVTFRHIPIDV